jgi:hypothetical protein
MCEDLQREDYVEARMWWSEVFDECVGWVLESPKY